ncbi:MULTISPECIES: putative glycolipid-binding domain-containing protein [Roseovarius]|uniref:putative glycolipid-binding domain-containing protein n=1 Tax=Roseovarius TaxID=74030 RepID=UPI00273D9AAC|nr:MULTISPECIES: putative glycolipid-binding domain-containing protein [unclassified Roseovarius]
MIAGAHAILWLREDGKGNDACRFADAEGGYLIDGSSTDADGTVLRYRIRARADGTTRRVRIGKKSRLNLRHKKDGSWTLNDAPMPGIQGATDILLDFTPASFTLPIRRLALDTGAQSEIIAARLDMATEKLTPLHLVFRRISEDTYEVETVETGTTTRISVDDHGIVQSQPGQWIAQA